MIRSLETNDTELSGLRKIDTSKEEIAADIARVYHEQGKINNRLYYEYGRFSKSVTDRYGLFNELLEFANLPINKAHDICKEDLVADVMSVYEEHKHITKDLYLSEGKYSRKPIDRIFGSWNKMLVELGINVNCFINIPEEDLLNELRELYDEYHYCSAQIIKDCSKYSVEVYQRRFGSINKAFDLIGIPTNERGKSVVAKTVIETIRQILKEIPSYEVDFPWLVNDITGRNLHLDAYFAAHNLVLEYNGIQHYQPCTSWLGEGDTETFLKRQHRDEVKTRLLEEHGLRLLVIRYDEPIDRVSIIKKLAAIF